MHDSQVHAVFLGAVMVALLGGALVLSPERTNENIVHNAVAETPTVHTIRAPRVTDVSISAPAHDEFVSAPVTMQEDLMPEHENVASIVPTTPTESESTAILSAAESADVAPSIVEPTPGIKVPACPFKPEPNRAIVDFTGDGTTAYADMMLRANGTKEESQRSIQATLKAGVYDVRFAGHATHDTTTTAEYRERWYLELADANGSVTRTAESRDIRDTETLVVETVHQALRIPQSIVRVTAHHVAYPDELAQSVVPLCAVFDAQEVDASIETEQLSATATADTLETVVPLGTEQAVVVEERPMAVPVSIGIESALRTVPVPDESIIRAREAFVARTNAPIFPMLARAHVGEREVIATTLLAHEDSASTSATTTLTQMRVSLVRVSNEFTTSTTEVDGGAERASPFLKRAGLVSLRDTDGDGITDYDEEQIYITNSEDPFTGTSVLTDGERVLLGLDPRASSTEVVPTKSPRHTGYMSTLLSVDSVELVASSSVGDSSIIPGLYVTGQAPPLSFVTLYLYSTPVMVTVRADSAGKYAYTFDHALEDGAHELYAAAVDSAGTILAKSEPRSLVKTAGAISFATSTIDSQPMAQGAHTSVALTYLLLLLVAIGSIVAISVWKMHPNDPPVHQSNTE